MDDFSPYAYELLTVPTGSDGQASLTKTVWDKGGLPPKKALISVNPGVPIRWTLDGTTATIGTGHAMTSYMQLELWGREQIESFRIVSTQSATATSVSVTYLR